MTKAVNTSCPLPKPSRGPGHPEEGSESLTGSRSARLGRGSGTQPCPEGTLQLILLGAASTSPAPQPCRWGPQQREQRLVRLDRRDPPTSSRAAVLTGASAARRHRTPHSSPGMTSFGRPGHRQQRSSDTGGPSFRQLSTVYSGEGSSSLLTTPVRVLEV